MKRFVWVCCFAIFCAMGMMPLASALAEVPAAERIPITDPGTLELMGFPANAKNVYGWTRVTTEDSPLILNDFGGATHDYTTLAPKEFIGRRDLTGSDWAWDGGGEGCCSNLRRLGTETFADAVVHLPTGARVTAIRWWAFDADINSDLSFFVFEVCHPGDGPGPTTSTQIATGATSAANGNQSGLLTFDPFTVDNKNCHYDARVRFDDTTDLTFQKIRFEWVRQVSPAPAAATFIDVPITSPFFRFVEALVASGITGGCGPSLYCPDQSVTRAQMAVFLSTALGLSWP